MANDVVLGAAMRSNLLTLQNTQRSIDATQLRLATGKKINSALDGPQNFFTAQSLNNRASDLTRLLDGIGQSIQTITEADKGVTALTRLAEQAQAIASSARDELAATDGVARALGNVNLNNVADLATAFAANGVAAGDTFQIITTNSAGNQVARNFTLLAGDTAASLTARITDDFKDNAGGEITASVTSAGYLQIQSNNGQSFRITDTAVIGNANAVTTAGWTALGLGRYFEDEQRGVTANGATTTFSAATIVAGNTTKSMSMYESTGNLFDAGDALVASTITDANGATVISGLQVGDAFTFNINNGAFTSGAIALTATTSWQDVVDQVNQTAAVNTLIRAKFDTNTGQIQLTSLSDTVENVQFTFTTSAVAGNRVFDVGLTNDPTGNLDPLLIRPAGTPIVASSTIENVISFNSSTAKLDAFAKDYNTLRTQINDLVKDAEYRGVNLLRGDNLTTFFNEDNTSKLVTEGATFTADGLGLNVASFRDSTSIETTALEARTALESIRSFGSSLANNLSIIQTRQTFTQETINTLKAGASDLTDADLNEEGASLLALQTAQQLGVTSLSLASQSQQSVLRLF